jgi:hypothetical protein
MFREGLASGEEQEALLVVLATNYAEKKFMLGSSLIS